MAREGESVDRPADSKVRITGGDIRRYRNELNLKQVEFVRALGVSQAALSLIEKGRTAVSAEHVEKLRKHFAGPDLHPTFAEFEKRLEQERAMQLGGMARRHHLTITVWRWEEGLGATTTFRADQAADLITIRRPAGGAGVIAFLMPKKSEHWSADEIIVFEEAFPRDLEDGELCFVRRRRPAIGDERAILALAHVFPAARGTRMQYQPLSLPPLTFDHDPEQVLQVARAFFRGTYLTKPQS